MNSEYGKGIVYFISMLWLAGCSLLPQTVSDETSVDELSSLTIPEQWQMANGDASFSNESPSLPAQANSKGIRSQWHHVIQSPALDRLIEEAFDHNQDIQASAARVLAARSNAVIASGKLLPEVDANLEGGRQRSASGITSNNYSANLNVSWEVDLWDRLSSAEQAALYSVQEEQALYHFAQRSLASQVAIAWIQAIEAKRQYQLSLAQQQSLKDSLDVIEDGFSQGIREALDVYSARAEWLNGQTEALERKQTVNQTLRDLSVLMGRYPSLMNDIPNQLPAELAPLSSNLSSTLLESRPDVQAAYNAVLSQQSNVISAGANRLPRFTLTGSVGATSDSLSDVLRGDELVWNALGGLTAPIFNAGQLEAEEQRQQYLLEAEIAEYRQTALQAFAEVEQGLDNDHWIRQQVASARDAEIVSDQAEQQAFERYVAGLENLNTWLQAQRSAFARSSRLMALEASYFQNRIQLHLALGSDFSVFQ